MDQTQADIPGQYPHANFFPYGVAVIPEPQTTSWKSNLGELPDTVPLCDLRTHHRACFFPQTNWKVETVECIPQGAGCNHFSILKSHDMVSQPGNLIC